MLFRVVGMLAQSFARIGHPSSKKFKHLRLRKVGSGHMAKENEKGTASLNVMRLEVDYSDPKTQKALEDMTEYVRKGRRDIEDGRRRAQARVEESRRKRALQPS